MILNICDAIACMILSGLMGAVCGLFSWFLDYCFWRGNIFQGYLPRLAVWTLKVTGHRDYKSVQAVKTLHGQWHEMATDSASEVGIYKMLGGCAVCLNFHIAFWSWVTICYFSPLEWYYGFSYILVSSAVIRKAVGAVY